VLDPSQELVLARAVAAGDAAAIREFDTKYIAPIRGRLRRMALCEDDLAEIEQTVRIKLLVCEPGRSPRLVECAGTGKLGGLVLVAAVREALSLLRRRNGRTGDDWLEDLSSPDDDPRLAQLKARHRREFKQAFEQAVSELSARDRALLRLHLLRQETIDQIGGIYGVHRATAARWVEKAKRRLRASTRRLLAERWDLRGAEFERVIDLIESRIELSAERLLASAVDRDNCADDVV
jgi:RNA polymerase sigma-70 factor (ECF subfamily)